MGKKTVSSEDRFKAVTMKQVGPSTWRLVRLWIEDGKVVERIEGKGDSKVIVGAQAETELRNILWRR